MPEPQVVPGDVLSYFYSSGTTGVPKAVMQTNRSVTAQTFQFGAKFLPSVEPQSTILFLPLSHTFGTMVWSQAFSMGNTVLLLPKFELELFVKTISIYKVRSVTVVPPVAVLLAKQPIVSKYDLSCLEEILCGAAPLLPQLEEELKRRIPGVLVVQAYGMTEASGATHIMPPGDERRGSVGPPCPRIEAKIVDPDTGKELGPNQSGELCTRGPQTMKGYLNRPDATAASIDKDGWLHSGDLAYFDKDGYFYIVDRVKELIKYKGYQVAPAEIEDVLLSMPDVGDAAVTWIPDTLAGELPIAFIVRKPGVHLTAQKVKNYVAGRVAPFKQLRGGVRFLDAIPKSPSGKILRRKLRDLATQSKL